MTVTQDEMKTAAARAAIEYVDPSQVLGVGTGTTVAHFIGLLAASSRLPTSAVATSRDTERRLEAAGVRVLSLDSAAHPPVYVDGADEIDPDGRAIKGGGGAHTLEKAVATASGVWVCIVDARKVVERLGTSAPIPLEVLPAAVEPVAAAVRALGASPEVRLGRATDAGNALVDVAGLDLADPDGLEDVLDAIPGVVGCGLFSHRRADIVIVGEPDGTTRTWTPRGR